MNFLHSACAPASTGSCCARLARPLLALALVAGAAQAAAAPQLFRGTLEVREQQGGACDPARSTPYGIAVQARLTEDRLAMHVWGDMAPAAVHTGTRGVNHPIEFLGQSGSDARVELHWKKDGTVDAPWRERAAAGGGGCSFTDARLRLEPVTETDAPDAARVGEFLERMFTASAEVRASAAGIAAMATLAQQLPPASDADAGIAETFLLAGRYALAQRPRERALALFTAASEIYRRSASRNPEDSALGLLHEARAQRRVSGPPAGEALVREALDLLARSGHPDGPAASSALSLQGSWRLAAGDGEGAASAFGRAAEIDEKRTAPATERVLSLSNLGAALVQAGRPSSALQILRRALAIAESATDVPRSLTDGVRTSIDELQGSRSLT